DSVKATYNRANALAKQGKLVKAIEAYNEVLEREPEHEDALFNKDLVEKANENLKQQPAGDDKKPSDEGEKDPDQQEESEQQQNTGDQKNPEEQSDSEQSKSEDRSESSDVNEEQESQEEMSEDQQTKQDEETEEGETEKEQMTQEAEDQQSEQEAQEQKETDQAVQQWLRRIPDDPGGLLREKFSRQHQRQLRRQTQQMEDPW
ncbi:MAG: tetratricopeptide repeat protein, partial [Spirochaetales bacterium]|nr:tetratricopeptide repeat protein [Spirochaetales bacterium]